MANVQADLLTGRFRANLNGAGIALAEDDLQFMVDQGYLRPVQSFEKVLELVAADQVPGCVGDRGLGLPPGSAAAPAPAAEPVAGSLQAVARRIAAREISPVELTRIALERIQERDPILNAFQCVLADEAMASARQAESEILAGGHRGPLHGVPVAVKDLLAMAGTLTTAGSKILAGNRTDFDATAVARLRQAGAIIVGKTRMSEFAYSPGSNNDHYGPTRNPHGLAFDTGGSSSGSAAAVADGLVFAALGTDTGGSIRIPASFCGLVGLKPTFGRVSLHGGVPLAWSLDHLGPLTRTIGDAAILLEALAGHDPLDPRSRPGSGFHPRLDGGVQGLRVGVLGDDGSGKPLASPEVQSAWEAGLAALEAACAILVPIDLPELQPLRTLSGAILAMEAAACHGQRLREHLGDFGEFMRLRILGGFGHGPADYLRAWQAQEILRHRCQTLFDRIDVLSTPTLSAEAPALGVPPRISLTGPFNLLGWPALSVPVGRAANGLPLGMQLVGRAWDEGTVLRAGLAVERGLS
jgi:aspartyl-tRNA(Asn)/glutamyl-tRNA(Gln) amidotransferase subunit A